MSKEEFYVDNFKLTIDLDKIVRELDTEGKRQLAKTIALESDIFDSVLDYMCGEDKDGCWTTEEPNIRQKFLERAEKAHVQDLISQGPRYGWRVWSDIEKALKDIRCKRHIYWALYHSEDEWTKENAWTFFKNNKIESDYTTDQADKDIADIKRMISDAMASMWHPEQVGDPTVGE